MAHIPSELVSHSRKVCSLYKRSLRCLADWYHQPHSYRFQAVLMRERFDKNKDIKDMRHANHLLIEGEKELFSKMHYQPIKFANSITGIAYNRKGYAPDWLLDYWHPLEKAMYPKYFARREEMKDEYIKWYNTQYPEVEEKLEEGKKH
ncbi:NADH dehydrogenase [ubiquinone] 1 beta subcomplex subunit 9 [Harpegnathos saltator]|uniref:NADH dehydrogenase [ubiquinone] 1 beta subcomplex subunit 9 n=1 Tax=Harpegnathos saltator TaxID=610380 RepID=E2B8Z8_HARSA|nr:NADH dehydrogenase [ubiquinone] 1 beta subcomplex subunit 9 [Harpegnathos saltator]EFN87832.1 NADH dehydrogenase [ubiquinone] 1 beta subcomplex subunit 9 [Harpegnathos saltator]